MHRLQTFLRNESIYLYLLFATFLAIFLKFWEPGIGLDSALYGTIAKGILKTGQWFHLTPNLGQGLPFYDHPYLVIWLHALAFKIFGASAQTLRLASSLAGLGVFTALFFALRRAFDSRVAILSSLSLMLVNIFMNHMSGGMLDMPMIAFTWGAVFFGFKALDKNEDWTWAAWAGLFAGLAVLAKGAAAIGILIPGLLFLFRLIQRKKYAHALSLTLFCLAPILLYTLMFYKIEGVWFWQKYFMYQTTQNSINNSQIPWISYLWYVGLTFQFGHLITILGVVGSYHLWRNGKKDWALLIWGQLIVHTLVYSSSPRHFYQYTTPVFPWLAVGAGYLLAQKYKNLNPLKAAKFGAGLLLFIFIGAAVAPVRVHSGNENPFRAFAPAVSLLRDNRLVYLIQKPDGTMDIDGSTYYVPWFWDRPFRNVGSMEDLFKTIQVEDPTAVAVVTTEAIEKHPELLSAYGNVTRCLKNDLLTLLANKSLCTEEIKIIRERAPAKAVIPFEP